MLHGLGRTTRSLRYLARALNAEGHPTLNLNYPSRRHDVRTCAAYLRPAVIEFQRRHGGDIAFVVHSMGSLVARVLAADPAVRTRAVVMLGPPNAGSEVADYIHRFALGRLVLRAGARRPANGVDRVDPDACPPDRLDSRNPFLPAGHRMDHSRSERRIGEP